MLLHLDDKLIECDHSRFIQECDKQVCQLSQSLEKSCAVSFLLKTLVFMSFTRFFDKEEYHCISDNCVCCRRILVGLVSQPCLLDALLPLFLAGNYVCVVC